jgi:hypothetical protein
MDEQRKNDPKPSVSEMRQGIFGTERDALVSVEPAGSEGVVGSAALGGRGRNSKDVATDRGASGNGNPLEPSLRGARESVARRESAGCESKRSARGRDVVVRGEKKKSGATETIRPMTIREVSGIMTLWMPRASFWSLWW